MEFMTHELRYYELIELVAGPGGTLTSAQSIMDGWFG
jgi:hypothetical protein